MTYQQEETNWEARMDWVTGGNDQLNSRKGIV